VHVVDLFAPFGQVKIKLMFGGAGVYYKDQMFALVADDRIYLKANDETRPAFAREGSKPFVFESKAGETVMTSYLEVPPRLLDDTDELARWARRAYEAAIKGRGKKKPIRKSAVPRELPLVSPRKARKR
jgi:DNA transformation protein and related proteins